MTDSPGVRCQIGVLTHVFPFPGEWFLKSEADFLEARLRSRPFWFPRSGNGDSQISNAPLVFIDNSGLVRKFIRGLFYFPFSQVIFEARALRQAKYRVNFLELIKAGFDVGARLAHILSSPHCDVYYSYWSSVDGLVAVLAARRTRGKSMVRSHNSDFYTNHSGHPPPFLLALHSESGQPSVHVYLSEKAREYARTHYGDTVSVVAPLGIEVPTESERPLPSIAKQIRFRIMVSASTTAPAKRLELMARVYSELERRKLVDRWVHFGAKESDFVSQCGIHLTRETPVECRGEIPNSTFRQELRALQGGFFINLSSSEGLPVTILEAAEAGLPIVATDVGVVSDLIEDDTGLLLNPQLDATAIVDEIERWLQKSDLLTQVSNLRGSVLTRHDASSASQRILSLILKLSGGKTDPTISGMRF